MVFWKWQRVAAFLTAVCFMFATPIVAFTNHMLRAGEQSWCKRKCKNRHLVRSQFSCSNHALRLPNKE